MEQHLGVMVKPSVQIWKATVAGRWPLPVIAILFVLQIPRIENVFWCVLAFGVAFLLLLWKVCVEAFSFFPTAPSKRDALISLGILLAYSIAFIVSFACVYLRTGLTYDGQLVEVSFADALYFSTATWTTLGYGDFQPAQPTRLVAAAEAFLGFVYMAVILGMIVNLVSPSRWTEDGETQG